MCQWKVVNSYFKHNVEQKITAGISRNSARRNFQRKEIMLRKDSISDGEERRIISQNVGHKEFF
jgi:hypothetical protein